MMGRYSDINVAFKMERPWSATRRGVKSWLSRLDVVVLFAFTCGAIFLHGQNQMRILGISLIISFPLVHFFHLNKVLCRLFPLPPEIKLYTSWVAWAGITGAFIAADFSLYFEGFKILVQMFAMVWAVYTILRSLGNVNVVYWALLAGCMIQLVVVLVGIENTVTVSKTGERLMGLTSNPNSLGFRMVWCVLCGLMLWSDSVWWQNARRILILLVIPVATYVLLETGSRKSALGMGFLIVGWTGYALARHCDLRHYLKRVLVVSVVVMIFFQILPYVMHQTAVGNRFILFLEQGQGSVQQAMENNVRYLMYRDGIRLFFNHPISGVGLNNFQHYFFTGQYSHSDYIEPLVTTGLVGFILYQSFYICLLIRSLRLIRMISNPKILYRLKMVTLGVSTIMLLGMGTPHYTSQPTFILLTAFSVYTWILQQNLQLRRAVEGVQRR